MSQENTKQVNIPTKELLTVLGMIQLISNRGGFKPEEFVDVGTAYQKIYEFLVDLNVIKSNNNTTGNTND